MLNSFCCCYWHDSGPPCITDSWILKLLLRHKTALRHKKDIKGITVATTFNLKQHFRKCFLPWQHFGIVEPELIFLAFTLLFPRRAGLVEEFSCSSVVGQASKKKFLLFFWVSFCILSNKPASQAARTPLTDATNRQNPTIQQSRRYCTALHCPN